MVIYGSPIAQKIYKRIKVQINKNGLKPQLAIILVGNNRSSIKYIQKKSEAGKWLGIKVIVNKFPINTTNTQILETISAYNNNSDIDAIVVQLPLPKNLDTEKIINHVVKNKDVDGFRIDSIYKPPISLAVLQILENIYIKGKYNQDNKSFSNWLSGLKTVVIGKGRTGGKPIYQELSKIIPQCVLIDSQTENPDEIIRNSNLVISCTGKRRLVNKNNCPTGGILITVGLHDDDYKLKGDYLESEIMNIAGFYTPTPLGIGPVNIACLMENVVKAARFRAY